MVNGFKDNKQGIIGLLVFLFLCLVPCLIWVILLDREREKTVPPPAWGSPEEIMAALVTGFIVLAIILAAVVLQKRLDRERSRSTAFPSPGTEKTVSGAHLTRHFGKPAPRPFDRDILTLLWDGVTPPALRILMAILFPLTLVMLGALILLFWSLDTNGRLLSKTRPDLAPGIVKQVEKKQSRSGNFLIVDYEYRTGNPEKQMQGRSYTDIQDIRSGHQVQVEYLPGDPGVSRIRGMRTQPLNLFIPIAAAVVLTGVLLPGIVLHQALKKRFLKTLVCEGILVNVTVVRVRQGGRGIIMARIHHGLDGITQTARLITPALPGLYHPLEYRMQQKIPVRVLVHPLTPEKAYLLEPHL